MENRGKLSNTLAILDKYHLQANKKYGQNFLVDLNIIQRIVDTACIDENTCVIEIGPGIGSVTEYISKEAKHVIAYEIDEKLIPVLSTLPDNVEVILQDFLDADIEALCENVSEDRIVVVSNLPYYITSEIITKILLSSTRIDRMVFMLQKEVANKFVSEEESSPLKILMNLCADVKYEFNVSKQVFVPKPHVDSAVISLQIKECKEDKKRFYAFLQECFKQRRKTLNNNLRNYPGEIFEGIDLQKRAEQVSLDEFIQMYHRIPKE